MPSTNISEWMPRSWTAALAQQRAHGVGHAANADLQAGAVFDLRRDQRRDLAIDVGDRLIGQLRRCGRLAVDDVVDVADVHRFLRTEDVRHRRTGLDDHRRGALGHRLLVRHRAAEVEVAVVVHRTGLDAGDVDALDEAAIVVGRLAEVHRDVVAAAGVVPLPIETGEVPAEPQEVFAGRIALDDRARPQGQRSADLHAVQLRPCAPPAPDRTGPAGRHRSRSRPSPPTAPAPPPLRVR